LPALSVTKHEGIVRADCFFGRDIQSQDKSNYKVIKHGQFAYATIHLDEGSIGRLTVEDAGLVSPMYTVFDVNEQIDPAFLFFLLKSEHYIRRYQSLGQGTVNRRASISFTVLGSMYIHYPPLPEQRAIADILGAVDETTARTLAVIEQLREAKQAVMDSLLDSKTAEQRGNGWKSAVLDELISGIEAGSSPQCLADAADVNEWGVLKISAITGRRFKPEENKALPESMTPDTSREVRQGDVLVCRANGQATLVGSSVYVYSTRPRLLLCDKTWRLLPSAGVDPRFLVATLQSRRVRQQIANLWNSSSGQKNISQESLRRLQVVMRHPGEQQRIGEIFQAYDQRIDAETAYLEQLAEAKCGLAQGLLSGAIRCGAVMVET